ncbi:hypothetical protein E2C01_026052 [Portunus trituberculatus]|uniref:Uncharacterized protein n=1 Tax=Portunus trituberculatus TaxID=210409 RepID=A0A5B7EHT6_PORTR|nr:hypothetical protein [Portunus trituberculatus]
MVHNRGFGVELTASLYPACSLHRQLLQKEEFSSAHDDMNKLDRSRRAGWTHGDGDRAGWTQMDNISEKDACV